MASCYGRFYIMTYSIICGNTILPIEPIILIQWPIFTEVASTTSNYRRKYLPMLSLNGKQKQMNCISKQQFPNSLNLMIAEQATNVTLFYNNFKDFSCWPAAIRVSAILWGFPSIISKSCMKYCHFRTECHEVL